MKRVAIVGAGPAGLVAARYLNAEGFEPVLFEQAAAPGGQWSGDERFSGVWPSMHTNTSRVLTAFSDLPHAPGLPLYPSTIEMRAYLRRYAEQFDLVSRMRLNCPVHELSAAPGGRRVGSADGEEVFEKVVVASGRFHRPMQSPVPGIEGFRGREGVAHTYGSKDPERYRGQRVLVAGCAISALEIASDLAMLGAARVVVCHRGQRYVLPKLAAGVPTDHRVFTRYEALVESSLPREEVGRILKQIVLKAAGSPEHYGAPKPADSVFDAGLTLCQHFLPLAAEGCIAVGPWIDHVDGTQVHFTDREVERFDAILFGTGFGLSLLFLGEPIRRTLDVDAQHIDLVQHTSIWTCSASPSSACGTTPGLTCRRCSCRRAGWPTLGAVPCRHRRRTACATGSPPCGRAAAARRRPR